MKNKTTIIPCLRKNYSSDKEGIINIRVTEDRKSKYISLKINIKESNWNFKKCGVKEKHKESELFNSAIENMIIELKKTCSQTDSIQSVKAYLLFSTKYISICPFPLASIFPR
ncbi:MAG: hypothetical protein IPI46_12200 [Bacteroidetes bacterium]|nr:hypothetical protein [Bacteroidota bacterium]